MISGDGFFVTQTGNGEQQYTRAGSFDFDSEGRLVTSNGAILQGWTAANGKVDSNSAIGDLSIPYGSVMAPKASTTGAFSGNLSSAAAVDTEVESQITLYDALGNPQQVTATYKKTDTDTWDVTLKDAGKNQLATGSLAFDPTTGALTNGGTMTFTPSGNNSWTNDVTVDLSTMTQYSTGSGTKSGATDGYASGSLQSFSLTSDGTIVGVYSNGLREDIGKLALATFANPSGLEKAGDSSYRVGNNSGAATIGAAGVGGAGTLTAGALEMSNVDLASEFTDLIIAQRGFQANSRVITASDEILQSLVQLGK
jgi:flagellar hook protein FlgE